MGRHEDIVRERTGAYGPVRWMAPIPDNERNAACYLGRMLGLYDHVTGNLSMLPVYADPDNRGMALARIGRWYEDQPKRVRQAYSSLCQGCRGIGREQVLADDFDMEVFMEWYTLEKEALACDDILKKVLHKVWGGDIQSMLEALSIPGKVFESWNRWQNIMSMDVMSCLKAAFLPMIRTEDGYRLFSGDDWDNRDQPEKYEDYADVRKDFAGAWRAKEDELLALPPERRSEAWEN